MLFEQIADQGTITDVALHEEMASVSVDGLERIEIAGIRQLVEVDNWVGFFAQPLPHETTADEASATGDQEPLPYEFFLACPALSP